MPRATRSYLPRYHREIVLSLLPTIPSLFLVLSSSSSSFSSVLLFLFPRSSPFLLHASLSFSHPVPVAPRATLFSPKSEQQRATTQPSRVEARFPHAALNALHSSQREQTRAGPQEAAWAVLSRLPEPSAPGAVPGFRASSCVPADVPCTRDWYAQLTRPYANPLLHLPRLSLSISLRLVSRACLFSLLPPFPPPV